MNVLIVEDNPDYIDVLSEMTSRLSGGANISVCTDAESAIALIQKEFFDLVVLDMSIPAQAVDATDKPAHGMLVLAEAQQKSPGTPILILTGSSAREYGEHIEDLVKGATKADIWGSAEELEMVSFNRKRDLLGFEGTLNSYIKSYEQTRGVELDRGSLEFPLTYDRLIRIFARSIDGATCTVAGISGGLSGTPVFRLHVRDAQGNLTQSVVCKLGELLSVLDEASRYDKFANRLPPAATPRKVRVQRWGAAGDAGVFYQLASGYDENVFSILHDGSRIVETINELKRMTDPWARGQERRHFSDIRRIEISDADFADVRAELNFDWIGSLENQMVQTSWSCTHGDLHGANILVDQKSMPILIDFGDMSDGPATRDPITLELSALFHVDGPMKGSGWPGDSAGAIFLDIDTYLQNCPSPEFVKACRSWADARSVSKREILAVAYAYLVRQAKYSDTDKDLIRGLLQGVRVAFERT